MAFEPGRVVADYEVIRSLGEGAVAEVYLVKHRVTGRLEAMKVLHRRGLADQRVDRFLREIQLQAGLSHPNIAAVRTALEVDGELLMIMEYVEGQSLRTIIEQGRPEASIGLDYILQALSALEYAHGHQITHRDVTPSNMLVSADGKLKLTDFGLAKAMGHPSLTQTGTPLGSLFYMSPEHVRGIASADHRSDIYSVGAILYELVTGSPPFQGNNAFEVMRAQVEEQPRSPSDLLPGLIPGMEEVLIRALQKDPEQRFASAAEMRQALVRVQRNTQTGRAPAPAAGRPRPGPSPTDASKSLMGSLPARLGASMKQLQWWAPSLGAVLALLLLITWIWTQPQDTGPAEMPRGTVALDLDLTDSAPPPASPKTQAVGSVADSDSPGVPQEEPPVEPVTDQPLVETAGAQTPPAREAAAPHRPKSAVVALSRDSATPAAEPSIAVSGPEYRRDLKPSPEVESQRAENRPGSSPPPPREVPPNEHAMIEKPQLLESLRVPRLSALTVSRDGSVFAGAANDLVIHVWSPRHLRMETLLEGHLAPITALTFGPEMRLLASGDQSGVVKLWDLDSRTEVASLSQKGAVQFVAFSRNGEWMATGSSDESVGLWKRTDGSRSPQWERAMKGHKEPPLAIAFSPDGERVVTSSDEKSVRVWPVRAEAKPQRIEIQEGGARALTFSEDGRWLAAASATSLTIWDASHLEQARQVVVPEGRHIMAFTPSGLCLVASATFRTLRLWEATTGQELAVLDQDIRVQEMTMTPAGDRLIVADATGGLRIWQVPVPDASVLRAQSALPSKFFETPKSDSDSSAASESEGRPLGIFRHVIDIFH